MTMTPRQWLQETQQIKASILFNQAMPHALIVLTNVRIASNIHLLLTSHSHDDPSSALCDLFMITLPLLWVPGLFVLLPSLLPPTACHTAI